MKADCVKTLRRMLLAAMLLCVLLISCAFAETSVFEGVTTPEADFAYTTSTAEDGSTYCVVTKYNGSASVVVVPSTLGGYPVQEIGESAFASSSITHIDIPSSVTEIGGSAFYRSSLQSIDLSQCVGMTELKGSTFNDCTSLTDVKLPAGLTAINARAFYGCSSLKTIDIPDSVHTINYEAFGNCTSLTTVPWPRSFKSFNNYKDSFNGPFSGCTALKEIVLPEGAKTVPDYVFRGSSVEKVVLPSTVKTISKNAFKKQTSVKSITAKGLTSIAASAFNSYPALPLETVDFSACTSLGSIEEAVFKGCSSLTNLMLPEGLTYIGRDAFKGCSGLKKLHVPSTVTKIYRQAFENCTALEEINYPKNLELVVYDSKNLPIDRTEPVFHNCNNIKKAVVPEGTTSIISEYFTDISSLETVELPSTLKTISYNAFGGCSSLKEIELPDSLQTIYGAAFSGCASLESIDIPLAITTINENTFANCTNLQSPDLTHITSIGTDAFKNCISITGLYLSDALTNISGFSGCTGLTQLTLPDSVQIINSNAFSNCTNLTDVFIPESVTRIYDNAFNGCTGLTDVDVPSSVINIGTGAFLNCPNITIWCKSGSAAHQWAANNGVNFVVYDEHSHQFEFFKTVQPSCTERGETLNKCSICGFKQAVNITPALGHNIPAEFTQISQVSCTTDGVWVKRCSRCRLVHEKKEESSTGHTYKGDWVITRQPSYYSPGRKEKSCTVCDSVTWQSLAQLPLPEEMAATHATAIFTVVNATTNTPISGANLEITVGDLDVLFTTGADGKVRQLLPIGEHVVTVWCEGMRSRTLTIEVTNDGSGSCTIDHIGLSDTAFMSAELTVKEMTIEEIEEAKIDINNPDNQHVSRYQFSMRFGSNVADLSYNYYKNNGGAFVAGGGMGGIPGGSTGGEWVTIGEPVGEIPLPPMKFEPEDPEKVTVTVYPLSEEMYLIIYGDVCWLKEMFDVELMVFNNTMTEKLTQVYATLTLPKGLSLASTLGEQQNSSILLDTIDGGARKSAHWYVRGDAEGDYDLTAQLSAVTDPHYEVITQKYTTQESIHVYGSNAMQLTWYLPDTAYANKDYIARAVLENITEDRTLYNVSHTITGLKKATVTHYSNETDKGTVEVDDGRLASGFAREFAPGDQLVIELTIPVTTDSDVIKRQATGYEAAVREAEKLYAALPLAQADERVMDSLTVFLQELNLMKEAGLLSNSGTALSAMENALDRAALLKDNAEIQKEILQAFSALKSAITAIPVRYELMESELTVLTDAASSIPMQVEITSAGGDKITSLETYLENFINTLVDMRLAADGGVLPPNFTIETLTQAKDHMSPDTSDTIRLATGSSKTILIQAPEGAKVWSQYGTLTLDALGMETEVQDGKMVISGSCYIQVTPGQQDDILYVETQGTTRQIQVNVSPTHTCSGQWAVVYYATENTDGFEVQLCSTCNAVLNTRTTHSCGRHVFAENAAARKTLWSLFPSACADALLSVQTRVCRNDACHVLEYDIVDDSGAPQKMITFHVNGGQGDMSPMSGAVGGACILPSCTFTGPDGLFFLCWNTQADGQGTSYKPGESFPVEDHTTLYARWLPGGSLHYDMSQVALEQNAFIYDGTEHTVAITGLPEGVTIASITGNSGKNAAQYTVTAQLRTDNPLYETPVLPEMTWEILPRPITLTPDAQIHEYNGEKPVTQQASADDLLPGHLLHSVLLESQQSAVGQYAESYTVRSLCILSGEKDVTRNYLPTVTEIQLTITARPATVKANDQQSTFTGREISGTGCTVDHLLNGHRLASVDISGSARAIGRYPGLFVPSNARIVDAEGVDVTSNYQVTYIPGDLTIAKSEQAQLGSLSLSKNHRASIRGMKLDSIQVNPAGQSIIKNSQIRDITFLLTDVMAQGDGVHLTGATHVESVTVDVGDIPGALDALIGSQVLLTLEDQSFVGMLTVLGDPALFNPQWISGDPQSVQQVTLAQTGQTLPFSQWIATLASTPEQ